MNSREKREQQRKKWENYIKTQAEKMVKLYDKDNQGRELNYLFNDKILWAFGLVKIANVNLAAKALHKECHEVLLKLIKDIGATNCVFFIKIEEKGYKGWVAWHGKKYKVENGHWGPSIISKSFDEGLRRLFVRIDRARKFEYLNSLCWKYKKSEESDILE